MISERSPEGPPLVESWGERWVRDSDDVFRAQEASPEFLWVVLTHRHENELRAMPEHDRAVAALRNDPEMSGQLDVLVGTPLQQRRISAEELPARLVERMLGRIGAMAYDEQVFGDVFAEFEAAIKRDEFTHVILLPLSGVETSTVPISLGEALEVDAFGDDEIARCLEAGYLRTRMDPTGIAFSAGRVVGVRSTFQLPKTIGDDQTGREAALSSYTDLLTRAQTVPEALRAFQAGDFIATGYVMFAGTENEGGHAVHLGAAPSGREFVAEPYSLDADGAEEFAEFWPRYEKAKTNRAIALAARRFGYAFDRTRLDDRLVDIVIGAEALLLSDQSERTELRFRFALRAAFYIAASGMTKEQIYKEMRHIYDVRSAIVHGGTPPSDLVAVAKSAETLTRLILRKAIDGYDSDGMPDWNGLVLDA